MATYNGTSARNIWTGTASADTGNGNGGDDTLYGRAGNDTLNGGTGNDGLYGEDGNDSLNGGDGIDALFGAAGSDTLRGGNGDDYLDGGIGDDGLYGDAGIDRLRGGDGIDALFGGADNDDLMGQNGNDYLAGGIGNDNLVGGAGNDRLRGEDGNDTLIDGIGVNDLMGGAGNDTLVYNPTGIVKPGALSLFFGDAGYDTLKLDTGAATFDNDPPYGAIGEGYTFAYVGTGGIGVAGFLNDYHEVGAYMETVKFSGIEKVVAGSGSTLVYSGTGTHNTEVIGSDGNDYLRSGAGSEKFTGGAGSDLFRFTGSSSYGPGHNGTDRILDFNPKEDHAGFHIWRADGNDTLPVKATEKNGSTFLTVASDIDGHLMANVELVGVTGLINAANKPWSDWYEVG
jgi:Ca2+-binding RTX toxin-like protein